MFAKSALTLHILKPQSVRQIFKRVLIAIKMALKKDFQLNKNSFIQPSRQQKSYLYQHITCLDPKIGFKLTLESKRSSMECFRSEQLSRTSQFFLAYSSFFLFRCRVVKDSFISTIVAVDDSLRVVLLFTFCTRFTTKRTWRQSAASVEWKCLNHMLREPIIDHTF